MENKIEFYSVQTQILRQSQSKFAFEYLQSQGITVTLMELHRVTDVFIEMCMRPLDNDLKERIKSLDNWIRDKKKNNE